MDIIKQSVVDKGLIVSSPRSVHEIPKIFQDGVVQPDGNLSLSRLGLVHKREKTSTFLKKQRSMPCASASEFLIGLGYHRDSRKQTHRSEES